jgi:hypothetical protein
MAGFRSIILSCPSFCTTDCAIQFFRTPRFNTTVMSTPTAAPRNKSSVKSCCRQPVCTPVCLLGQIRGSAFVHPIQVRGKALTPKQLSSVPCPTCGVSAGMRCERYMGVPRKVPHVDRKFAAVEAGTNGKAKRHRRATQARHPIPTKTRRQD